jgi:imidazolonepropionase-like amidohydrolase
VTLGWLAWAWATPQVWTNARAVGGEPLELHAHGERFTYVGPPTGAAGHDLGGATVVPGFIDSHVHLSYLPEAPALADGCVAAAVDLAAPITALDERSPLTLVRSGPMITAVGGYPTQTWGRDGYGLTCVDPATCAAAVDLLVARGAAVIKVPFDGEPWLGDPSAAAVAARAHHHGKKLVAHALSDAGAARAARAGADVLAHAPVEPLTDATLAAWADRAVIGTLGAFGGDAAENLALLHAAGATVLYGTDFGNTRALGVDPDELQRMTDAGLPREVVWASATSGAAAFWGFSDLGVLRAGAWASFCVVDGDPMEGWAALGRLRGAWLRGQRRGSRLR